MNSVTIMEVSPRDGLQNEAELFTTQQKLQLVDHALASGCKRIEVTSFVHPERVPQMADAEAVCASLPQRGDVRYTGLVLNKRGYERLLATQRLDEAGMVVPASDTFGMRNQGQTVDESVAQAQEILRHADRIGFRAQVTIAVAFGCPFEGQVPPARVVEIARALADAGPVELALADTIGVAVPGQVGALFNELALILGKEVPLRAHFHDTRNTAIANAWVALAAGVQTLDSSMGGIGGCPFAPDATGNVATEDLLYMLDRSGISHGLDFSRIVEGARWLEEQLHRPVPSKLLRAGGFPGE
ncbi:MAG: hydroxymethylglutaryl-CoA lyase [Proteobacteria bacterium]|nr:hydroxymethylglutaryl-CoA lyase [Pseudomonadota bacterium]